MRTVVSDSIEYAVQPQDAHQDRELLGHRQQPQGDELEPRGAAAAVSCCEPVAGSDTK